jgi:hypothetical protein
MLGACGERWSRWHHNSRGVCIRMFDLLVLTSSIYVFEIIRVDYLGFDLGDFV